MIDISGEIKVKREKGKSKWKVAIEKPLNENNRQIQEIIELDNASLATSGNYRKYFIDSISGEKYVHIINPKNGFARSSNIISATVIGKIDCSLADAMTTAIMVMGFEKAKQFIEKKTTLDFYLIYSNEKGELKNFYTQRNFYPKK